MNKTETNREINKEIYEISSKKERTKKRFTEIKAESVQTAIYDSMDCNIRLYKQQDVKQQLVHRNYINRNMVLL